MLGRRYVDTPVTFNYILIVELGRRAGALLLLPAFWLWDVHRDAWRRARRKGGGAAAESEVVEQDWAPPPGVVEGGAEDDEDGFVKVGKGDMLLAAG